MVALVLPCEPMYSDRFKGFYSKSDSLGYSTNSTKAWDEKHEISTRTSGIDKPSNTCLKNLVSPLLELERALI